MRSQTTGPVPAELLPVVRRLRAGVGGLSALLEEAWPAIDAWTAPLAGLDTPDGHVDWRELLRDHVGTELPRQLDATMRVVQVVLGEREAPA